MEGASGVALAQLQDLLHRDPGLELILRVHPGLDGDRVAGGDAQLRRLLRIEPSPLDRLLAGLEDVMFAGGADGGESSSAASASATIAWFCENRRFANRILGLLPPGRVDGSAEKAREVPR